MLSKAGTALAGMSGEEMAAMKKMMGQTETSFFVSKAGQGETIAGYETEKYLLKGPMEIEIHSAANLRIPAAYYDVMKLQMPSNPLFDMRKMYDEMKKINGIPLKTITIMRMMGQEMKTTKVVTSIEKGAIPASVFEVPAGYKLVQPICRSRMPSGRSTGKSLDLFRQIKALGSGQFAPSSPQKRFTAISSASPNQRQYLKRSFP
jgi:hypothetical protein